MTFLLLYTLGYVLCFTTAIIWNKKSGYTIDKEVLYAIAICCMLWPLFLVISLGFIFVRFMERVLK